uniref:Large ribosomal subunit protein uL14m n=1 Tax=Gallus gallus TaxID=9031 RepID=A0A8V0Z4E2_CHICK
PASGAARVRIAGGRRAAVPLRAAYQNPNGSLAQEIGIFVNPSEQHSPPATLQKLTRVRVVDNSALGNAPYHRPPKCIHVYNKTGVGKVGDKILLAIKGEKKKALIVGHKMPGPHMTPRFDSNNVVLIEDNGNPLGTRIKTPIPYILRRREGEFSKVLAIARNFV